MDLGLKILQQKSDLIVSLENMLDQVNFDHEQQMFVNEQLFQLEKLSIGIDNLIYMAGLNKKIISSEEFISLTGIPSTEGVFSALGEAIKKAWDWLCNLVKRIVRWIKGLFMSKEERALHEALGEIEDIVNSKEFRDQVDQFSKELEKAFSNSNSSGTEGFSETKAFMKRFGIFEPNKGFITISSIIECLDKETLLIKRLYDRAEQSLAYMHDFTSAELSLDKLKSYVEQLDALKKQIDVDRSELDEASFKYNLSIAAAGWLNSSELSKLISKTDALITLEIRFSENFEKHIDKYAAWASSQTDLSQEGAAVQRAIICIQRCAAKATVEQVNTVKQIRSKVMQICRLVQRKWNKHRATANVQ